MEFDYVARTHVGCRRKLNEDAVLAEGASGIWAVADGMGGHDAGEVASARVIGALGGCPTDGSLADRAALASEALRQCNAELIELARMGDEQRTIGSTVVVLLADADGFACLWAGDSRGYRFRDGGLEQLTRDHSLVQELVDAGMLDASEANTHPNANIITCAVGAAGKLDVDSISGALRSGDLFLLASDGLTRVVNDGELASELGGADDLAATAERLISLVLARGAPDNVSLILIRAS